MLHSDFFSLPWHMLVHDSLDHPIFPLGVDENDFSHALTTFFAPFQTFFPTRFTAFHARPKKPGFFFGSFFSMISSSSSWNAAIFFLYDALAFFSFIASVSNFSAFDSALEISLVSFFIFASPSCLADCNDSSESSKTFLMLAILFQQLPSFLYGRTTRVSRAPMSSCNPCSWPLLLEFDSQLHPFGY